MHIFPNNKKYIGIAKEERVDKRWGSNGNGYINNRQPAIERAIKKYGWKNVKHVILEDNLSKEESKSKEQYYIKKYNTFGANGYNLTPGGDDNSIRKGKNNPSAKGVIFNGTEYSTLKEFCECFDLKIPTVSSWLHGHSRMPEKYYLGKLSYVKDDLDSSKIVMQVGHASGARCGTSKTILFNNKEYGSLREFCQIYNVDRNSVRAWCSGKYPMPSFFYDNGLRYKDEDNSNIRRSSRKDKYIHTKLV